MYFKQINEIVSGAKTQTRRVCKVNERITPVSDLTPLRTVFTQMQSGKDRLKWQTGRDYAVSPGRGKPGVWWFPETGTITRDPLRIEILRDPTVPHKWQPLRIRLLSIRREPLQDITEADAIAEGCTTRKWDANKAAVTMRMGYRELWQSINGPKSWGANPDVWVLTFTTEWAPSL